MEGARALNRTALPGGERLGVRVDEVDCTVKLVSPQVAFGSAASGVCRDFTLPRCRSTSTWSLRGIWSVGRAGFLPMGAKFDKAVISWLLRDL